MSFAIEGGNLQKLYEQKYLNKNTISPFHNKYRAIQERISKKNNQIVKPIDY